MGLYPKKINARGSITRNETVEGRPVERMWRELKENPSTGNISGKELMYPQEGIPYGTDIRGNKWDQAIQQTNKVTKAITAARKRGEERRAAQIKKQQEERAAKGTNEQKGEGTASSE